MHKLDSQFVRDQLAQRVVPLNEKRTQPDGEYVLYWMQATHRLEENWALRFATLEANRLGRPLLIHQGLDPTYPHASDRHHAFILEGARELAQAAHDAGYAYQFVLRRRRDDDRRVVDRVAARACLVVTDLFPTAGVLPRAQRFADRVNCRVLAVDSFGIVPSGMLPTEEYAARTIRPKLFKVLDLALEPVRDEPPSRALPDAVWRSLDVDRLELAGADLAAEIARCEIDHAVPRAALPSGGTAARAALAAFVKDGLHGYDERRRHPSDFSATSHLSPWLHFGHIPAARVARTVLRAVSREAAQPFLDQLVTWRELAFNFCLRNPRPMTLDALPAWVHATMRAHARDRREHTYTLEQLEHAGTYDDLWNAGQRELVQSGVMHNVVRMLWGKSVLTWAPTYADALAWLLHLNDKYALDGRDPNSVAGIQWCFGKFDRPFAERPVWGVIRPMSLERARSKYELDAYLARWGAASQPSLFG